MFCKNFAPISSCGWVRLYSWLIPLFDYIYYVNKPFILLCIYMTYWIKNISWVEQPRITCYINWKDLEDRDIKPNEVIEVVAEYYKDKPMIWKVEKSWTKKRHERYWIRTVIWYIVWLLSWLVIAQITIYKG